MVVTRTERLTGEDLTRLAGAQVDLVLVRPTSFALADLAPRIRKDGTTFEEADKPGCPLQAATLAGAVALHESETYRVTASVTGAVTTCYMTEHDRPRLVQVRHGTKTVTVLGFAAPHNRRLTEEGNAALAMNLLGTNSNSPGSAGADTSVVWLVPDIPREGAGAGQSRHRAGAVRRQAVLLQRGGGGAGGAVAVPRASGPSWPSRCRSSYAPPRRWRGAPVSTARAGPRPGLGRAPHRGARTSDPLLGCPAAARSRPGRGRRRSWPGSRRTPDGEATSARRCTVLHLWTTPGWSRSPTSSTTWKGRYASLEPSSELGKDDVPGGTGVRAAPRRAPSPRRRGGRVRRPVRRSRRCAARSPRRSSGRTPW